MAPTCQKVAIEGAYHEILMEQDALRDVALDEIVAFLLGTPN